MTGPTPSTYTINKIHGLYGASDMQLLMVARTLR